MTKQSLSEMTREFHETYNLTINTLPTLDVPEAEVEMRKKLIEEEFQELKDALEAGDIIEVADALADLLYVVSGAGHVFGIDLDAVLVEVQRSNLSKLGEDGKPLYREDGKVLKGPNFSEPDIERVLAEQVLGHKPAGVEVTPRNLSEPSGDWCGFSTANTSSAQLDAEDRQRNHGLLVTPDDIDTTLIG